MTHTCRRCFRPVATEEDWANIPEGEGEHLCWGDNCDDRRDERIAVLERALEALQRLEWASSRHTPTGLVSGGRESRCCPVCGGVHPDDTHPTWRTYGHTEACSLREILAAAILEPPNADPS